VTTDLPLPSVDGPPAAGQAAGLVGGDPQTPGLVGGDPQTPGVPPTFEQIFHDEAAYVGRTLRYLGVREAHVEDACQEVFVVIHRRLGKLRRCSVRAWVRQICVRVASNHRRSLRRRPEDAVAEPPEVAVPATQHGEAERRQARQRLLGALDALSEEQRHVFVLYEIEQLTMPEIAEAIGCALQTAYSRLYAARIKVETAMKGTDS
jgi:RNA polymerase sigma-70 factor, ECF subfamily